MKLTAPVRRGARVAASLPDLELRLDFFDDPEIPDRTCVGVTHDEATIKNLTGPRRKDLTQFLAYLAWFIEDMIATQERLESPPNPPPPSEAPQ